MPVPLPETYGSLLIASKQPFFPAAGIIFQQQQASCRDIGIVQGFCLRFLHP